MLHPYLVIEKEFELENTRQSLDLQMAYRSSIFPAFLKTCLKKSLPFIPGGPRSRVLSTIWLPLGLCPMLSARCLGPLSLSKAVALWESTGIMFFSDTAFFHLGLGFLDDQEVCSSHSLRAYCGSSLPSLLCSSVMATSSFFCGFYQTDKEASSTSEHLWDPLSRLSIYWVLPPSPAVSIQECTGKGSS